MTEPTLKSLQERWSALPDDRPAEVRPTSGAPASPAIGGATSAAVRPIPVAPPRASKSRSAKVAPRTESTTLAPLLIAAVASVFVGTMLAFLQMAVWMTPLFEIGTGAVVGFALVPLRRHADASQELLSKATIGCVSLAFAIFLALSCLLRDVSALEFIASTSIGSRASLASRTGVGLMLGTVLFALSFVGAWVAALKTHDVLRDETLDRF